MGGDRSGARSGRSAGSTAKSTAATECLARTAASSTPGAASRCTGRSISDSPASGAMGAAWRSHKHPRATRSAARQRLGVEVVVESRDLLLGQTEVDERAAPRGRSSDILGEELITPPEQAIEQVAPSRPAVSAISARQHPIRRRGRPPAGHLGRATRPRCAHGRSAEHPRRVHRAPCRQCSAWP